MPRTTNLAEKIEALRRFCRREQRVPGYQEMLRLFNYRSKNAVFSLVNRLAGLGYLRKSPDGKLGATARLTGTIRLLGAVQAGFPSPAEEELVDTLSLDEYLINKPEATFMLTVSGDSMIEAGIYPGDIVLVEKGGTPRAGQIVVAQVDGEWTLKRFGRDRQGVYLDPANHKYPRLRPSRSLVIGGIVTAVIRKY